jgi:coenzyme PQQ precursor peptide PqqA
MRHSVYWLSRARMPVAQSRRWPYRRPGSAICRSVREEILEMAWKTPRIVEVPVGMEINMYACAARK